MNISTQTHRRTRIQQKKHELIQKAALEVLST
ncbi:TetR family transcriptional regulator, partial [Mesorhizobium sp. M00.F.Ca.ET.158.01.1.1]